MLVIFTFVVGTLDWSSEPVQLGEGDKLKIYTFFIFFWILKYGEGPNHVREDKKLKFIHGNPPVHGVWKFSDPPVGPMENAKNPKSESFIDYGQNVFYQA